MTDDSEIADAALQSRYNYEKYCKDVGVQNSCHIPRSVGEDISLLTEVVFKPEIKNLFPIEHEKSVYKQRIHSFKNNQVSFSSDSSKFNFKRDETFFQKKEPVKSQKARTRRDSQSSINTFTNMS